MFVLGERFPRQKAGCTHRGIHASMSQRTSLSAYLPPLNSLMLKDRRGLYRENHSEPMRCFATVNTMSGSFAVLWSALFRPETGTEKQGERREDSETTVLWAAQSVASKAWRMGLKEKQNTEKGES